MTFLISCFQKSRGKFLISLVPVEGPSHAILLHLISVALFAEQSISRRFIQCFLTFWFCFAKNQESKCTIIFEH